MYLGMFNNNILVMSVGYEVLKRVFIEEVCVELNEWGDGFRERLK